MTLLHEAVDFKKLDVRLIERNLQRGVLTQQEVNKSVQDLPDDAESAVWTNIEDLVEQEK
jgi:hypothetical protein